MSITITVNGEEKQIQSDPDTPLLWVLRDELGLKGSKFGCGVGHCGACTVHMNGEPLRSCAVAVDLVAGTEITTIEGLPDREGNLHPVQQAWMEHSVPQCGYCQSGQIMSAVALLKHNPSPDDDDIKIAMAGNLCRCGTYSRIKDAIKSVAGSGDSGAFYQVPAMGRTGEVS